MKSHRIFLISFAALFLAYLGPLLTLKSGFVLHDYALQHYPWAAYYSEWINRGVLPLWTDLIGCGFPLFAEGQTGMLYPLNLALFAALPLRGAYNGEFLLHFMIAGAGCYAFMRGRGVSNQAAALASAAFCFGGSYAGLLGGLPALRALCWFPVSLYFIDHIIDAGGRRPVCALALVWGMALLAGAPQNAAYAIAFGIAYALTRSKQRRWALFGAIAAAAAVSLMIAAVQLWATFELSSHSTRLGLPASFALWGSTPPWSFAALFNFPMARILGPGFYAGAATLVLACAAAGSKACRGAAILILLSVLLALGSFNPLNGVWAHLPVAGWMRNPSKFLFFTHFFICVTAAHGLDLADGQHRLVRNASLAVMAVFAALWVSAWALAAFGTPLLEAYGRWHTGKFVIGEAFHRYPAPYYDSKLMQILETVRGQMLHPSPWTLAPYAFALALVLIARSVRFKTLAVALTALDLILFGVSGYSAGLKGNIGRYPELAQQEKLPRDGRWLDLTQGKDAVIPPNRNLLTGQASLNIYAPLVDRDYFDRLKGTGAIDDSMGRTLPEPGIVERLKPTLDLLGVRYIVAPEGFTVTGLKTLTREVGRVIYVNERARPVWEIQADGYHQFTLLSSSPVEAGLKVDLAGPGRLIRDQRYETGWQAWVDGLQVRMDRYEGLLQSVELPKGGHDVRFVYRPDWFVIGRWFYALGLLTALGGFLWRTTPKKT